MTKPELDWEGISINSVVASIVKPEFNVDEYEKHFSYLNWKNSSIVPWSECVRGQEQPLPETEIQRIYYQNNKALRKALLTLFYDILSGSVDSLDSFRDRFSYLHKTLIMGENGNAIYVRPDQQLKIGDRQPKVIAGYYGNIDDWSEKLNDLLSRLRKFLDPNNFQSHSASDLVKQIGDIFFYNLNGDPNQFAYGWNSFNMNITNALLRLVGYKGISHETLDIEFNCQMQAEKFPQRFSECVNKYNE